MGDFPGLPCFLSTLFPDCNVTSCLSRAPPHRHRHLSNCKAKINTCLPFLSGSWSDIRLQKQGEKDPGALEAGAQAEPLTRAGPQPSLMLPGKLPFVNKTKEQTHSTAFKLW